MVSSFHVLRRPCLKGSREDFEAILNEFEASVVNRQSVDNASTSPQVRSDRRAERRESPRQINRVPFSTLKQIWKNRGMPAIFSLYSKKQLSVFVQELYATAIQLVCDDGVEGHSYLGGPVDAAEANRTQRRRLKSLVFRAGALGILYILHETHHPDPEYRAMASSRASPSSSARGQQQGGRELLRPGFQIRLSIDACGMMCQFFDEMQREGAVFADFVSVWRRLWGQGTATGGVVASAFRLCMFCGPATPQNIPAEVVPGELRTDRRRRLPRDHEASTSSASERLQSTQTTSKASATENVGQHVIEAESVAALVAEYHSQATKLQLRDPSTGRSYNHADFLFNLLQGSFTEATSRIYSTMRRTEGAARSQSSAEIDVQKPATLLSSSSRASLTNENAAALKANNAAHENKLRAKRAAAETARRKRLAEAANKERQRRAQQRQQRQASAHDEPSSFLSSSSEDESDSESSANDDDSEPSSSIQGVAENADTELLGSDSDSDLGQSKHSAEGPMPQHATEAQTGTSPPQHSATAKVSASRARPHVQSSAVHRAAAAAAARPSRRAHVQAATDAATRNATSASAMTAGRDDNRVGASIGSDSRSSHDYSSSKSTLRNSTVAVRDFMPRGDVRARTLAGDTTNGNNSEGSFSDVEEGDHNSESAASIGDQDDEDIEALDPETVKLMEQMNAELRSAGIL